MKTQELFDFDAPDGAVPLAAPVTPRVVPSEGDSGRFLVPQALFLSWSPAMQLSYCAARDLDSTESAHLRGEDPEFYQERAEWYAVEALRVAAR